MTQIDMADEFVDICRDAFKAHRDAKADSVNRDMADGYRMLRLGAAQGLEPVVDRLLKLQDAIIQAKNASSK